MDDEAFTRPRSNALASRPLSACEDRAAPRRSILVGEALRRRQASFRDDKAPSSSSPECKEKSASRPVELAMRSYKTKLSLSPLNLSKSPSPGSTSSSAGSASERDHQVIVETLHGQMTISTQKIRLPGMSDGTYCHTDELQQLEEIGRGAYGAVFKFLHRPTRFILAVKVRVFGCRIVGKNALNTLLAYSCRGE
jgi:hypothetical protein